MTTVMVVALCVMTVLVRGFWLNDGRGAEFRPMPDCMEYAASAQGLADSGKFFLQIGSYEVRPRYSPGWPMVLAIFLLLGIEGTRLWWISVGVGALTAVVLALLTRELVRRQVAPGQKVARRVWLAGDFSGLLVGLAWCLAPLTIDQGQTLMTDEVATLGSILALLCLERGASSGRGGWRWWLLAGFGLGVVASIRSVSGVFLLLPALVALFVLFRRYGMGAATRYAIVLGIGGTIAVILVTVVLVRSGFAPWLGGSYSFWVPEWYERWTDTFNLRYAIQGNAHFSPRRVLSGKNVGHFFFYLAVLSGIPGFAIRHYTGLLWPAVGGIFGLTLWWRSGGAEQAFVRLAGIALALWLGAHIALYSVYFTAHGRFLLGPMALLLILTGLCIGTFFSRSGWRPITIASGLTLGMLATTAWMVQDISRHPRPVAKSNEAVRAAHSIWIGLDDAKRSRRRIGFDTVRAQAIGLMTREDLKEIQGFGRLEKTLHVQQLRLAGRIDASFHPLASPFIHGPEGHIGPVSSFPQTIPDTQSGEVLFADGFENGSWSAGFTVVED
ncbi:MAG: hypothetical protein DRJ65_00815 [Acidobacteria bacterium]|nr:MAG: hypothetical protein DRJ65_00815 [Acidobacteriota bacterium]